MTTLETVDPDVINPPHYKSHPSGIECINITSLLMFDLGNAVKYVWRRNDKGKPLTDLSKAEWYMNEANKNSHLGAAYIPVVARKLLTKAAEHESDENAANFYKALAVSDIHEARSALHKLLEAAS